MKLLFFIIISIIYSNLTFSQNQIDKSKLILTKAIAGQKLDSIYSKKAITDLDFFNLTDADKENVSAALKHANELRRQAIENYWHTPSFYKQFNKGNQYQDSVLQVVLGKDRYMRYKVQLVQKQDKFKAAQRLHYLQQKDSVNRDAHPNTKSNVQ